MPELMAGLRVPPIDWRGVPYHIRQRYENRVSALCTSVQECEDLVRWFGAEDFCPFLPVLLMVPGTGGILLSGLGLATVSELRDDAVGLWHLKSERMEKHGSLIDFDEARERHGQMRREDVPAAISEALRERARKHLANPVTDPARQPIYPNPTEKVVYSVDGLKES